MGGGLFFFATPPLSPPTNYPPLPPPPAPPKPTRQTKTVSGQRSGVWAGRHAAARAVISSLGRGGPPIKKTSNDGGLGAAAPTAVSSAVPLRRITIVATADPKPKLTESGHQGEGEGGLELSGALGRIGGRFAFLLASARPSRLKVVSTPQLWGVEERGGEAGRGGGAIAGAAIASSDAEAANFAVPANETTPQHPLWRVSPFLVGLRGRGGRW